MSEFAGGGQGITPSTLLLRLVQVADGHTIDEGTNLPVARVIWQIGFGGQAPRLATVVVTQAHPNSGATACHFQAQAIAQGT